MSDRYDDPRVRELTYRLMEMAPDAPPFPQEATVKVSDIKQRQPMLVWATAAAAVVLLVGLPLFLFRGGDGTTDPATTIAAPVTTTVAPGTTTPETTVPAGVDAEFSVYLFSSVMATPIGDPALVPVYTEAALPATDDGELAVRYPLGSLELQVDVALGDLYVDPNDSFLSAYSSSIPSGTSILGVSLDGGVATVDLSAEFEAGGGTMAMTTRLAQVVYTATQFPEVDSVLFMIEGEVVDVFSGEGIVLDGPQTREDYVDILPFIFLDTPAIGSVVESPVQVTGIANVFEATVMYEIVDADGNLLNSGFTTASCGTGCWGDFSVDVDFTVAAETQGHVVVFEESARDGSRINELRYPVTLLPGDGAPTTTTPSTTTVPPVTTSTTLAGEPFDIGPVAGDVVAVVGVAHDDVLNLREGPGTDYVVLISLGPLTDDLVATGNHRLLPGSIWNEVTGNGVTAEGTTVSGITGWVNSGYIGYIGSVDDITASVIIAIGEDGVEAETMVDLAEVIVASFEPEEPGFRYEISVAPTVGDLGEVTVDVLGIADDSQRGFRLHIFGAPTEGGEGFSLKSVEATSICGRGVTAEGFCV